MDVTQRFTNHHTSYTSQIAMTSPQYFPYFATACVIKCSRKTIWVLRHYLRFFIALVSLRGATIVYASRP